MRHYPATVSTTAREALSSLQMSCPAPTAENRQAYAFLEKAAQAEIETDPVEMAGWADWLERIAAEQEAAGKVHTARENREKAARYRRLIASLDPMTDAA